MKILHLIIILSFILSIQFAYGQAGNVEEQSSTISISLVMPDEVEGLSASHLSKLENKILRMLTNYGLSGNGYQANFVIYPKFEIYGEETMAGMEKMTLVETGLSLFVKQMDTNIMFASYEKDGKGMARNSSKALVNAIKKIPTKSKDIETFLAETKAKILDYYQKKCNDIIVEADRYSQTNNYEQAIAVLSSIPSEVGECYHTAQEKAVAYYKVYANQKCAEYMQKAKAEESAQHYKTALKYLSMIDPSSDCSTTSLQLIQSISAKVDQKEQRNWNFLMKRYDDHVALQRSRIEAMAEVAKAYYQRTQPTIVYKSLF